MDEQFEAALKKLKMVVIDAKRSGVVLKPDPALDLLIKELKKSIKQRNKTETKQ